MIVKLVLALVIIAILWSLLRNYSRLSEEQRKETLKRWALPALVAMFVVLALTGHLNWLFAAVASLFALVKGMLPTLLRYLPALAQMKKGASSEQTRQQSTNEENRASRQTGKMDIAQAHETLGTHQGASKEEIIQAHRKLVQRVHPDRGGSAYLTQQINLARDVLLADMDETNAA